MQGRIIRRALAAAVAMLAFAGPASAQTIDQGPSRITTDATPTFTFSGEAGSTFECLIEPAGTWKSCSSPYSVQLPDGDYVFSVRATDGAGNVEPNPPRWAFTVDTSTVDTTIEGGPGDVTNDPTPSFTFATETTGATYECKIDGANSSVPAWASCSSPFEVPKLRSGAYTLNVRAKSPQGKFDTTPAQRAFTIDADAPDTTIVTGPGEGSRTSPIQKLEFSATEAGLDLRVPDRQRQQGGRRHQDLGGVRAARPVHDAEALRRPAHRRGARDRPRRQHRRDARQALVDRRGLPAGRALRPDRGDRDLPAERRHRGPAGLRVQGHGQGQRHPAADRSAAARSSSPRRRPRRRAARSRSRTRSSSSPGSSSTRAAWPGTCPRASWARRRSSRRSTSPRPARSCSA